MVGMVEGKGTRDQFAIFKVVKCASQLLLILL